MKAALLILDKSEQNSRDNQSVFLENFKVCSALQALSRDRHRYGRKLNLLNLPGIFIVQRTLTFNSDLL